MSVSARCLIECQFIPNSITTLYTSPSNTSTIIDKFTVTNVTAAGVIWSAYLVPNGESPSSSNILVSQAPLGAHQPGDVFYLQNQVLNIGDSIAVIADTPNAIVLRCSGRQVQ